MSATIGLAVVTTAARDRVARATPTWGFQHSSSSPPSVGGRDFLLPEPFHGGYALPGPTEAHTRRDLIDPALEIAGWDLDNPDQVGLEIPLGDVDPAHQRALERKLRETGIPFDDHFPAGITDYALYRENGEILAVVEAKRTSVDPRLAVPQVEFYTTQIEQHQTFWLLTFMANGQDIARQSPVWSSPSTTCVPTSAMLNVRQNTFPRRYCIGPSRGICRRVCMYAIRK
jgi:hypothetical protein